VLSQVQVGYLSLSWLEPLVVERRSGCRLWLAVPRLVEPLVAGRLPQGWERMSPVQLGQWRMARQQVVEQDWQARSGMLRHLVERFR
jgi:hypothetical protein